jgi:hypothetical protein
MRSTATPIGPMVAVVMTVLAAAGVYNVLGDNTAVQRQAALAACGPGAPCKSVLTRLLRTPFFQDFDFRTSGQTVRVRCNRSLYLVGAYACARR